VPVQLILLLWLGKDLFIYIDGRSVAPISHINLFARPNVGVMGNGNAQGN